MMRACGIPCWVTGLGLSAMVLAPSPDRSDVPYLGQGVIAERGSSAFLNKP